MKRNWSVTLKLKKKKFKKSKKIKTHIFNESGFRIVLPENCYFRFENIGIYKRLSGQGLKEMDFCWWNEDNGTLYLLEVFNKYVLSKYVERDGNIGGFLKYIVDKTTDSLLMLASAWIPTESGNEILQELPTNCQGYPGPNSISINFLIRGQHDAALISNLHDRFRGLVLGKTKIFDSEMVAVLDYEQAVKHLPISINNL